MATAEGGRDGRERWEGEIEGERCPSQKIIIIINIFWEIIKI